MKPLFRVLLATSLFMLVSIGSANASDGTVCTNLLAFIQHLLTFLTGGCGGPDPFPIGGPSLPGICKTLGIA